MIKSDLHVHSKYSTKPTNWILKQFNVPESYTKPLAIYETALKRGMTHVTITDHDNINGCLEIAHLPNTFISCEVTSKFPQDKCKVHVLCYGLTEETFREIDALRKNIYELMAYLRQKGIWHALAHPIYPVNDKLTQAHFEQLLVLFDLFELSGFRSKQINDNLKHILHNVTREQLEELAGKHDIDSPRVIPEEKHFVCGSDDHSGVYIARSHTINPGTVPDDYFGNARENEVCLRDAAPIDLAYSIYSIGYQYMQDNINIDRWVPFDSSLRNMVSYLSIENGHKNFPLASIPRWFVDNFTGRQRDDTESVLKKTFRGLNRAREELTPHNVSQKWFDSFSESIDASLRDLFEYNIEQVRKQKIFGLFRSIGSIAALYFVSLPYYISYKVFQNTRNFSEVLKIVDRPEPKPRVAHFTDTFYEINGVALTMQQMARMAREMNLDYNFVTCRDGESLFGEKVFQPITTFRMPEYPQQKLTCPPILDIIDYCYEMNFTHIHSATPGPLGMVGLMAAKMLGKPFYTTYHTAFPQYVEHLTGDQNFAEFAWSYMRWFCNMADKVFVPSKAFREDLVANGIVAEKIEMMPRGIDTERFKPNGAKPESGFRLLYVGRISREKNLDVLVDAFKQINRSDTSLTFVGEGPYRAELEEICRDLNVEFRGYLTGQDLVNVYCESDIFVFPSTTDTFGNVILEAHACGVPTIVTDSGGPQENVREGETGLIVSGHDVAALKSGIESLMNKELLRKMGSRARELCQNRTFGKALLDLWKFYEPVYCGKKKAVPV